MQDGLVIYNTLTKFQFFFPRLMNSEFWAKILVANWKVNKENFNKAQSITM